MISCLYMSKRQLEKQETKKNATQTGYGTRSSDILYVHNTPTEECACMHHETKKKCHHTHGVFCAGQVKAQVRRREPDHCELADASVLQLRLSEEVDRDPRREPDGVETDVACGCGSINRNCLVRRKEEGWCV